MNGRKIYIARHGERLDFVDPEWYSKAAMPHDPPLTARGKEQATQLGQKLSTLGVKHIYASPFSRCVNTASNAAAAIAPDLQVNIEPGACEWLNEDWYAEAKLGPVWRDVDSLSKEFSNVNAAYEPVFPMSHNFDAFPESRKEMLLRCEKTIRSVLETAQGDGNILVVGHGSSVEGLIHILLNVPPVPVTYCCLTECIPTEEPFKYKAGMLCETSFLTQPENQEEARYI